MSEVLEALIGFDLRRPRVDMNECEVCCEGWDEPRRERFLLRPDSPCPLSVDRSVWPTAIDWADKLKSIDYQFGLPTDLDEVDSWLACESPRGDLVAIGLAYDDRTVKHVRRAFDIPRSSRPAAPEESWCLLGYDVADRFETSGISNCGYELGVWRELRSRWGLGTNRHNLLIDYTAAAECAGLLETLAPEHAHFFVYALWLISPSKKREARTQPRPLPYR